MKRRLFRNSSVLFVVIVFSLMAGVALAEKKHWFVVKDKGGTCRVIEADTVAGPFKTMAEAEKRKARDCAKGAEQPTEQVRPQKEQRERIRHDREQAEPMRRQHMQREELQQEHSKQQQTPRQQKLQEPQQQQQTEKLKEKAQEKIEGAKPQEEKVKEKAKEPSPSDKKN